MLPRPIVHALGDLKEKHQVLGPQIESIVGSPKVKAAVRAQLALGVLARMPLVGLLGSVDAVRHSYVDTAQPAVTSAINRTAATRVKAANKGLPGGGRRGLSQRREPRLFALLAV
jgi:hypothetical protein